MINVFIDTSIFVSEGFVKGKSIATLFEAAREEKIRILMPDITEHEVRKHLYVEVKKSNGEKAVEKLKKSYMYAVTEFRSYIEKLMDVTAEALAISVEKELDSQFNMAAIERLALSEDLDFLSIVEDYKALNPPFSEKKNKEFPDAIVLKQLEGWCKKHDDKCVLLSTDPDLKKYKSDNLEYRELSDFVASLEEFEKMISQDKLKAVFEASRERLEEGIKEWINEQYEDDSLFINYLLIEDIYGSYINNIDIQWDIEPFKWVGKDSGCLFYKTYAYITASIAVSHPDYETGYYDSEDGRWFFIDDNVTDYLEGRIRVPITLEYIYGTDEMEIDSINNDLELSRSEVLESLVSIGRKEFGDDEDFEVEHEICPHCKSEVMVYEYNYTGKGGKKEDIICPKCKKVICTLEEADYYRVELMEQ